MKRISMLCLFAILLAACTTPTTQAPAAVIEPTVPATVAAAVPSPTVMVTSESADVEKDQSTAVPPPSETPTPLPPFTLTSSAFEEGQPIPDPYTCWGEDISPELTWVGAPVGTQSFAIVVDDPDARGFIHWTAWNIPAGTTSLAENELPEDIVEGKTNFNSVGYRGPCPPSGTHHYNFTLYALDTLIDLPEGASLGELESAMEGHILAETVLMGTFTPR